MSDEAEQALVSLLLAIREGPTEFASEHARKREHKRFVKKLVTCHERRALAKKLNVVVDDNSESDNKKGAQAKIVEQKNQSSNDEPATHKKVRIELCEAIFKESKSSNKKGGKSSSKDNTTKSGDFKVGAKKIMVFSQSASVEDVLKEAKSKLRMKKKPTRCFVVSKKISMDLVNLRGIEDGDKVYVTSQEENEAQDKKCKGKVTEEEDGDDDENDENDNDIIVDPLDAVKEAYVRRKRRWNSTATAARAVIEHPKFQNFFHQLPPLSPERAQLPAASCREKILEELDNNRVLVVCGATGCGKSTQIPQFLHEGMVAAGQMDHSILVTQPRRVAATSLAKRVATEMNSPPPGRKGSLAGYSVRLDRAVSDSAKIVFCTVGILLRMLVCPKESKDEFENASSDSDNTPNTVPLSSITHVVIDEVHERDVNTDFVLTLLRQVLVVNENIRVILMSATAAADLFVRYFEEIGMKPNVLEIPGRTFPVDIHWITECERFASSTVQGWKPKIEASRQDTNNKHLSPRASDRIDNFFIRDLIRAIVKQQQSDGTLPAVGSQCLRSDGAILVFLPGKAEIEALAKVLYEDQLVGDRGLCNILKLHSTVAKGEQEAVFVPARGATVKIILATNLAETSLTVPDV